MDALGQLAATPLTDPFDRVLIAQAIAEESELVTTDREISQYASAQFRVIS